MPELEVTGPDGEVYLVPAENAGEAANKFSKWWSHQLGNPEFKAAAQQRMNQKSTQEGESAPFWAKPFMAADDVMRVGADAATFGLLDKGIGAFTGKDEGMETAARRARMGWAAPAAEVVGAIGATPTLIPKLVAKVGGGPLARSITGVLGGAAEGAVGGGIDAATHGQSVIPGALSGAAFGAGGQTVGNIVNKTARTIKPHAEAPIYDLSKLPESRAPTAMDYVNKTAHDVDLAVKKGANVTTAARDKFADLTVNPIKGKFNKEQQGMLSRIVGGDPADQLYSKASGMVANPLLAPLTGGIMGGGAGFMATQDPTTAALGVLAGIGGPLAARGIARGGTKEAVQDLRRSVYNMPPRSDALSEKSKNDFAKLLRQLNISLESD